MDKFSKYDFLQLNNEKMAEVVAKTVLIFLNSVIPAKTKTFNQDLW